MRIFRYFLLILLFIPVDLDGQENLDSLWAVWEDESQPDTARVQAIDHFAWNGFVFSRPDSALQLAKIELAFAKEKGIEEYVGQAHNLSGISYTLLGEYEKSIEHYSIALEVYERTNDTTGVINTLSNLGSTYKYKGNQEESLNYFSRALALSKNIGFTRGIAANSSNIGTIYRTRGDHARAIEYYEIALKMAEEMNNLHGVAITLNNIAMIYTIQEDYDLAIEYFNRSIEIREKIGNEHDIAESLNNLGSVYIEIEEYDKALDYFERGLDMRRDVGDQRGIGSSLNNIGLVYMERGELDQAMEKYREALTISEKIENKEMIATSLINLSHTLTHKKQYSEAIKYGERALRIAREMDALEEIKGASHALWEGYKHTGRHKEALEMYKLHIETRDSIMSEENQKEVIRQQYKYQYKKEAVEDSIQAAEAARVQDAMLAAEKAENKQHELESRQQKRQMYSLFGLLGLALLFGGFIYNRFRVTNRQKDIIEEQKDQVDTAFEQLEEKNQEILNSINYAKRIQTAILPPKKVVKEYLPDSFILYKPKDIVAGDFYWMQSIAKTSEAKGTEDRILFAACDCTGHGVPGAMVSVVCNNGLNRSVREYGITDPGKILDKTRDIVMQEFEKSEDDVKDGMDISLVSLSYDKATDGVADAQSGVHIEFAGANNPLWIIRKGATEVEEIKGNKMPIGKYALQEPFTTHKVELQKGDSIYVFSDGFADQFGGEKGKKFKSRNFMKLLLSIQHEPMNRQREFIDRAFEDWRGDLEQLDDVCVIGLQV